MMASRGRFPALFSVLGLLAAAGGCRSEPPPLRLATNVWPGYEPYYVAREIGAVDPGRLRLVELLSASQVISALRIGSVDAATLTLDEAIRIAAEGHDIAVVQVLDTSHGADALVAKSGIESVAALRGKRVGVEVTAVGGFLLGRALETAGMAPSDVTVVPLDAEAHAGSLERDDLDAVVAFEPAVSELVAAGNRLLFDSRQIPGEILDVLVVRGERRRGPGGARDLAILGAAWQAGLAEIRRSPDEALRRSGRLAPSGFDREGALRGIRLHSLEDSQRFFDGVPSPILVTARRVEEFLRRRQLLGGTVDLEALVARPEGEAEGTPGGEAGPP